MSLEVKSKIIFQDLISDISQFIKTKCDDVDKDPILPWDLKDETYEIASAGPSTTNPGYTSPNYTRQPLGPGQIYHSWNTHSHVGYDSWVAAKNNVVKAYFHGNVKNFTAKVNLSQIDNTVNGQLIVFLKSRGIYQKAEQVMTIRGILNFYNNIAIFLSVKIKSIQCYDGSIRHFYDLYNSSYFDPNIQDDHLHDDNDTLNSSILKPSYQALLEAFNQIKTNQTNKLTLQYASSSSSSSSSCSSCSCSCSCSSSSSSSSSYIVYMII